jgi:hypothetical protein
MLNMYQADLQTIPATVRWSALPVMIAAIEVA